MIRRRPAFSLTRHRVPRMRGDDPEVSRRIRDLAGEFPACAGMIRDQNEKVWSGARVPRMRGDDPRMRQIYEREAGSSPHARG